KSGADDFTTSVTFTECDRLPLVPVIVTGKVPTWVLVVVVTVSFDVVAVAGFGLNVAVAPVGRPLALRLTGPAKLPSAEMATVYVVVAPCRIVRLAGVAPRVKSDVAAFNARKALI